jgi:hypothetical protein
MKKIGIKFLTPLPFELFDSFQYLLDFELDYFDMEEKIGQKEIIELDIDEDEQIEDLEVLQHLLKGFDEKEIGYELYSFDQEWERESLSQIG